MSAIREFIDHHFRHFNAAALRDAAQAYAAFVGAGGRMLVAMGGAMSTAEIGRSLSEMIRAGKVHALSVTGANLEEDIYHLIAHDEYVQIPHYRDLTPQDERALLERGLNRVTDTCIPEEAAMRRLERVIVESWVAADRAGHRRFPHEFLYDAIRSGALERFYRIDPSRSWVVAAAAADLPLYVPGWEDSTLGNMFAAQCLLGRIRNPGTVRSGVEYFMELARWYQEVCREGPVGMLQIGGGIAGDFPICVVPMLRQDMKRTDVPVWRYFCQISEASTSYGSYSGAPPREKITWGKLDVDTPAFVIESDATIVAPLLFAYVLGW